jgi:hypothetical protein
MSGIPIALNLVGLSPTFYLALALIVLLEHGPFLSPMAVAWSHAAFGQNKLYVCITDVGDGAS